ncbi:hypothetical protein QLL95_gp0330 [Cotonvirus japonicus]|uniref:GIY-YIG nuclease family protein n=1 Tax=Cotonvirus japonicus TaxID=2811091 RepID=A0ABM7NUD6_9VIRU|nr:hypothetical protein QLL95_gp0330 [Cotonvirus japonicus]BCS83793.1 hypothetical protein [Cotonvirus japonicus]
MDENKNGGVSDVKINQFTPYSYDNIYDLTQIRHLIAAGSFIPLTRYVKKHVLYGFIIPLITKHNKIIIKFGYTQDIFKRIKTLQSEYKSCVYLIRLKLIEGEHEEKIFHDSLKEQFSELIEEYSSGNKHKVELYQYNPILIDNFDAYLSDRKNVLPVKTDDLTPEEIMISQNLRIQESIFQHTIQDIKKNMLSKHPLNEYFLNFSLIKKKCFTKEQ